MCWFQVPKSEDLLIPFDFYDESLGFGHLRSNLKTTHWALEIVMRTDHINQSITHESCALFLTFIKK